MKKMNVLPVPGGLTIEELREFVTKAGKVPATIEEEGLDLIDAYTGSGDIPLRQEAIETLRNGVDDVQYTSLLVLPLEGGRRMLEIYIDNPYDEDPAFWAPTRWGGIEKGGNPGFVVIL